MIQQLYMFDHNILHICKWDHLPVELNRLPNGVDGLHPAAGLTIASHMPAG